MERAMDGIDLELPLFLFATFAGAFVAGLSGFAFGLVAASLWLYILSPVQSASLIVSFGLLVQGYSVWKLRSALDWQKLWLCYLLKPSQALHEQGEEGLVVDLAHHQRVFRPLRHAPPVDDRHAHREFRADFDLHIAVPALEELGPNEIGDHARIVEAGALVAIFPRVESFRKAEHFRYGRSHLVAETAKGRQPGRRGDRLVRHIKRHHDDRNASFEDYVGGVRIDADVEFGGRGDVAALEAAAAHQHNFLDARRDFRLANERKRDIGQRADRTQRDRAALLVHQCLDDEIDGMLLLQGHFGLG